MEDKQKNSIVSEESAEEVTLLDENGKEVNLTTC